MNDLEEHTLKIDDLSLDARKKISIASEDLALLLTDESGMPIECSEDKEVREAFVNAVKSQISSFGSDRLAVVFHIVGAYELLTCQDVQVIKTPLGNGLNARTIKSNDNWKTVQVPLTGVGDATVNATFDTFRATVLCVEDNPLNAEIKANDQISIRSYR